MRSIFRGKGAMPSWEVKLNADWQEQALAYICYMTGRGRVDGSGNLCEASLAITPKYSTRSPEFEQLLACRLPSTKDEYR